MDHPDTLLVRGDKILIALLAGGDYDKVRSSEAYFTRLIHDE